MAKEHAQAQAQAHHCPPRAAVVRPVQRPSRGRALLPARAVQRSSRVVLLVQRPCRVVLLVQRPSRVLLPARAAKRPSRVLLPARAAKRPSRVLLPARAAKHPSRVLLPAHAVKRPSRVLVPARAVQRPGHAVPGSRPPPSPRRRAVARGRVVALGRKVTRPIRAARVAALPVQRRQRGSRTRWARKQAGSRGKAVQQASPSES
ncbi:hypothetical protein GUJ93_ZPchr0009g2259 [Zizania palustris]|uniref:Uncharacterized protein n=1 Tax=Zizania palustris TaxID=103762 RepID=A0A8J5V3U7_ZIZPA|nr:hypothetical protein GUJ93_ZPchr0009g2259 [Zizania palustris]